MYRLLSICLLMFLSLQLVGQECYKEAKEIISKSDFSNLWLDQTFQGVIGDNNQRIEIRFTSIVKQSDKIYRVEGKSKVKGNICDFEGVIKLGKIMIVDKENLDCEGPDYSYGYIQATYHLKENPQQNHVGAFKGQLRTEFDETSKGFLIHQGHYSDEGTSVFIGEWKEYTGEISKYCSWGRQIPPTKSPNLFIHKENEFYLFNAEFLNRGWRSYVLTNLQSSVKVPKVFDTMEPRSASGYIYFEQQEILRSREIEGQTWWK